MVKSISENEFAGSLPSVSRQNWSQRPGIAWLVTLTILGVCASSVNTTVADDAKTDPAVERARREVRMLDDLYKTSIVLVTTHYVKEESDLPAGGAFKALFSAMKEKGWHEVRLIDATGEPYEPTNVPKEGFEKKAIRKILDGQPSVDEVVTENGKRYLLAATIVPVVMDKCIMCHENYRNVPKGKAIGALGYKVPIQD